jgi:arginine decarboxylase
MKDAPTLDRDAFPVLVVVGPEMLRLASETVKRVNHELESSGLRVVSASTSSDALALVTSDPSFGCVVLDWSLDAGDIAKPAQAILEVVRARHPNLPVFLLVERGDTEEIPLDVAEQVQEFVLLFEDTPAFIAGRIDYAWRRYTDELLPPFFRSLVTFDDSHEYSWHTPGHSGGTAFRKSQVGKAFFDFYGENLFRTDLSVSVAELGSLLDHSGTVGEAERNAARIFGADMTFFVLNGTSTSNQIVAHSCVVSGDVVLADRNCHKSVNYALTVTDATPVYLQPIRNGFGIIGPIPPERLSSESVAASISLNPLVGADSEPPVYAVVTNSTYDGLCYRADQVVDLLGASVPRIHFDEAWFAYARFHPIYQSRFAMHDRQPSPRDPTIFATQSTHKLLAAFSQSSMIHVRSGERAPVEPSRFNEAYMMHGSTSPFYPMIASLDVAASMMDGAGGRVLLDEAIREAIVFRKRIVGIAREFTRESSGSPSWFFGIWQPDEVRDAVTGEMCAFEDVPDKVLQNDPSCWDLAPNQEWHGFGDLGEGYCMLDPTKVTLTTPGVNARGELADTGIPAPILSSYLDTRRVEVEKTGDYSVLVLFSIGTTNGKWGTLVEGLLAFKRAYDGAQPLAQALPDLVGAYPGRYGALTLRQLCDEMHAQTKDRGTIELLDQAFEVTPAPKTTPGEAYRTLVRGRTEQVRVSEMAGRVAAVMVVPYPPGIPILMPGECAGDLDDPILQYLLALEDFDIKFPGFAHDIHGVERDEGGAFSIECLVEGPASSK